MCTPIKPKTHAAALLALAGPAAVLLAALTLLPGCGGGDSAAAPNAARLAQAQAQAAAQAAQPLFDDQGRALPSAAHQAPADTTARTRNGLYASAAQYEWQELTAGPYTLLLDVDSMGSGAGAVASTLRLAEHIRGMRDTRGLAFFVRAQRPSDAAQVVNGMVDAGMAPVFMIH